MNEIVELLQGRDGLRVQLGLRVRLEHRHDPPSGLSWKGPVQREGDLGKKMEAVWGVGLGCGYG